ncbi:MAG: AAA domain-containing protein [bacterium]|nr:AAA domain-containing protein [bacterium]
MEKLLTVEKKLQEVILGKPQLIREFLTGLLAGGHILLEGLPGLGKTMMVRAFGMLCTLSRSRIQFTPDLMPLDITGSHILNENDGKRTLEFHKGPLFSNLVLADEINRAGPKTQSALLEAMQEQKVTVLGSTHSLPSPFMVLATQNPIELEGTYPLPEAQLDRFLFKLKVEDVPADVLAEILLKRGKGDLPEMDAVISGDELLQAMEVIASFRLSVPVASYIARLVKATHGSPGPADKSDGREGNESLTEMVKYIKYGASPRAALAIAAAARAVAFLENRDTVGFEDVNAVALPAMRHRIITDYTARLEGITTDDLLVQLMDAVPELERDAPQNILEKIRGK